MNSGTMSSMEQPMTGVAKAASAAFYHQDSLQCKPGFEIDKIRNVTA
jgi:hypothetical protein